MTQDVRQIFESRLHNIETLFKGCCVSDGIDCVLWLIEGFRNCNNEVIRLRTEIERLKRGDLTEAEFQEQCHLYNGDDLYRFDKGCKKYQIKKFGRCMRDVEIELLKEWINQYEKKFGPLDSRLIYEISQKAFTTSNNKVD